MEYRTSWPNHSRTTRLSPKTRSKRGLKASMSTRVSFTSKTTTEGCPSFGGVRVGRLARGILALLHRWSIEENDHSPLGLIGLHDMVRRLDVLEAEHARRLRLVTARLHVGR